MLGLAAIKSKCSSRNLRKRVQLPVKGMVRFIPKDGDVKNCQLTRNGAGDYIDKFDNAWHKPKGSMQGEFHWDVQLSKEGKETIGFASKSGKHLNVLPDGRIPH